LGYLPQLLKRNVITEVLYGAVVFWKRRHNSVAWDTGMSNPKNTRVFGNTPAETSQTAWSAC
jgi:hypothetical protein